MTEKEIVDYLKNNSIQKIKIAITDIDGVLRGKYIHTDKFLESIDKGIGFCDVIFGWDCADVCYDNVAVTGWHTGYPDKLAKMDLSTFRLIPWENNTPLILGNFKHTDSTDLSICPRTLLEKVSKQAKDIGFETSFAQEFEWYNFIETPQSLSEKKYQHLTPLTPGMFGYSLLRTSSEDAYYTDLFDLLCAFGIPIEGLHTETGPGVCEAAYLHDSILHAADKAALLKTAVKQIAYKHGIIATFMAKINENLPGSGGHIHQSLWNADKTKNVFFDASDEHNMSETMKQYLAGQIHCLPHILPMLAPTINSYKRLVEGAWAPTTLTWGVDNRTTALRVISQSPQSTRIEQRISGADTNPYLAMAASLASGLYGIKHKLKLNVEPTVGNGYINTSADRLAANLMDATQIMKTSKIAEELFGTEFISHFTATREWEWKQHLKHVSDWELKRYMEII
ncbi:glutamine synthetase family protein [uncultured Cytophaga sp.]|uniref:glutamine synthetase family protein n=1 Tax=uncultured Cytophaga sp. TaxID=160238 RepID=UPI00261D2687|nr:glutamine synthetase family protein [uncultured Cytophaga sp.]